MTPPLHLVERGPGGEVLEEDYFEDVMEPTSRVSWKFDSSASIDQWSSGLSTRAYPGFQITSQYEWLDNWGLGARFGFGASMFRVMHEVKWNQQIQARLNVYKKFQLQPWLYLGPSFGYFAWVSTAGSEELPKFQKHDLSLGAMLSFVFEKPGLELNLSSSFMPINLGLEAAGSLRYYFVRNWYLVAQSYGVWLFRNEAQGTFWSASLGLGVAI